MEQQQGISYKILWGIEDVADDETSCERSKKKEERNAGLIC